VPTIRPASAAVAAGVLLGGSVAAELVHPVQASDGAVVQPVLFAAYLLLWIAGAALLVIAAAGLPRTSRATRIGRVLAVAGAVLLTAFAVVVLATGLGSRPLEASFLAFALGLLLSAAGALTAGIAGRRPLLVVAGVGALVAMLAPGDPWHDLGLLGFCLAWAADGVVRLRTRDRISVNA
jgi:succinate-acetate transporter protein